MGKKKHQTFPQKTKTFSTGKKPNLFHYKKYLFYRKNLPFSTGKKPFSHRKNPFSTGGKKTFSMEENNPFLWKKNQQNFSMKKNSFL